MTIITPHYEFECQIGGMVCGIDEAGRGPLAGPVYAAAVILDPYNIPKGLNDSKKLSSTMRETLAEAIRETARISVGIASVEEIDSMNIYQATLLAMQRAYDNLRPAPDAALIDGNAAPNLPCYTRTIIKGDTISLSIAAASIIAKTERDAYMMMLHEQYPQYHFNRHAGYGTVLHKKALHQYGITRHHRKSFKPVRDIIMQQKVAA
jgi:ribonuclease HII